MLQSPEYAYNHGSSRNTQVHTNTLVVIITNDARWGASECVETHYPSNVMGDSQRLWFFFSVWGLYNAYGTPLYTYIYITQYNVT